MMFSTVKSELKFREDRLSSYEKRINSKVDSAETSVVTNQASEMAAYGPHECFGRCLTLFLLARDWDLQVRKVVTCSLGNLSCFLTTNFSHSVNHVHNVVFRRREIVVFRFLVFA